MELAAEESVRRTGKAVRLDTSERPRHRGPVGWGETKGSVPSTPFIQPTFTGSPLVARL